jgi:hypothetical protein
LREEEVQKADMQVLDVKVLHSEPSHKSRPLVRHLSQTSAAVPRKAAQPVLGDVINTKGNPRHSRLHTHHFQRLYH